MPEDFGTVGLALVFANFVELFVDFGFSNAIVQKRNVSQIQLSTVFWLNIMIGFSFSAIMYLCSGLISDFFNILVLKDIVKVYSITFIIKALSAVQSAIFQKELDYKKPVLISTTSSFISGALGVSFAFCGWGVWSLVISQVTNWLLSTSLLWLASSWRPSLVFKIKEIKDLWSFGYKYSLSVIIDNVFVRIDTLVIGKCFSASLLGFYYRAQSLNRLVIQYAFSSFANVLFPTLSKLNNDIESMKINTQKMIQVTSFMTFLFAGLMYVCSYEAMVILFGEKWIKSVIYFKILGLFSICYTLPSVMVAPVMSLGKSGLGLKIEIVKKIVLLISMPIGLYFGLEGYVWAINIAAAITMLFNIKALNVINIKFLNLIFQLCVYIIPFMLILALFEFVIPDSMVNNLFLNAVFKASIYFLSYCSYHLVIKSEGFVLVCNLIKSVVRSNEKY